MANTQDIYDTVYHGIKKIKKNVEGDFRGIELETIRSYIKASKKSGVMDVENKTYDKEKLNDFETRKKFAEEFSKDISKKLIDFYKLNEKKLDDVQKEFLMEHTLGITEYALERGLDEEFKDIQNFYKQIKGLSDKRLEMYVGHKIKEKLKEEGINEDDFIRYYTKMNPEYLLEEEKLATEKSIYSQKEEFEDIHRKEKKRRIEEEGELEKNVDKEFLEELMKTIKASLSKTKPFKNRPLLFKKIKKELIEEDRKKAKENIRNEGKTKKSKKKAA